MPQDRPGDDRSTGAPRRRAVLAAVASAGLAGCTGVVGDGSDDAASDGAEAGATTAETGTTATETRLARQGVPPTVCEEPLPEDPGIYAVVEPAFGADWGGLDPAGRYGSLTADTVVVGVAREEDGDGQRRARAYPLSVLTYHEVVNDDLGGPLLVTYCPLCKSGLVAERRVGGAQTRFHVTGLLWRAPRLQSAVAKDDGDVFGVGALDPDAAARNRGNLVMRDDRTDSRWSQILARAICGPATGDRLAAVPATTTTWGAWRETHPETRVLLPPPHSRTDERV